mmetsp:Transcript_8164/g.13754  ORF Transcript_8164/g.13754 Transcript_8164/m.13754 type:complete len:301 (+) Transcript_8164:1755-2657(+)
MVISAPAPNVTVDACTSRPSLHPCNTSARRFIANSMKRFSSSESASTGEDRSASQLSIISASCAGASTLLLLLWTLPFPPAAATAKAALDSDDAVEPLPRESVLRTLLRLPRSLSEDEEGPCWPLAAEACWSASGGVRRRLVLVEAGRENSRFLTSLVSRLPRISREAAAGIDFIVMGKDASRGPGPRPEAEAEAEEEEEEEDCMAWARECLCMRAWRRALTSSRESTSSSLLLLDRGDALTSFISPSQYSLTSRISNGSNLRVSCCLVMFRTTNVRKWMLFITTLSKLTTLEAEGVSTL